ncbi:spore germination protein [Defluviitalea raffinosedens]|uniref:spore germination protein n=1 Tax=Defluviitalea raffinosedens TaxID=1450156 RepID=UPI00195B7257|nr:spore germination protein [Defluviitalea raffinosedens]MBM7686924.1 hypothetical protein [Defluviitalea raffinosedens]
MVNNLNSIQSILQKNADFKIRDIQTKSGIIHVLFIETISDYDMINKFIIEPLLEQKDQVLNLEQIEKDVITLGVLERITRVEEAVSQIISGNTVLVFDDFKDMLYCDTKKATSRAVEIPPTESVIKGPREGLTEDLSTNISLIRKRLTNKDLKCELILLGKETATKVMILYLEGSAPKKLVNHVRKTLKNIDVNFVQQSNYIAEQLQDKPSVFDTVGYTEKPDVFAARLSEGRVGIFVDGDPFGITVPHFFIENFQTPSDYNVNIYFANYVRMIRWVGFIIAILLPPIYIALTTHHFSLIPPSFLFRLTIARAAIPFPIFIEILLMMFFFQLLREAGVRLPQSIGQAISIVGALILGDTAVQSGLASTVAVLLVALTSLSAFLVPNIFGAIAIWTDILILFSTLLGLPGFFVGFLIFLSHLASLTSCGYPYLYPIGTVNIFKLKDKILRSNLKDISHSFIDEDDA